MVSSLVYDVLRACGAIALRSANIIDGATMVTLLGRHFDDAGMLTPVGIRAASRHLCRSLRISHE